MARKRRGGLNRVAKSVSAPVSQGISGRNATAQYDALLQQRAEQERLRQIAEQQQAAQAQAEQQRMAELHTRARESAAPVQTLTAAKDNVIPFDADYKFKPETRDSLGHIPLTSDDQLFKRNLLQGSSGANTFTADDAAVLQSDNNFPAADASIEDLVSYYSQPVEYDAEQYKDPQGKLR